MRHRVVDKKFGRSSAHRKAMVTSLVCALIKDKRIKTTVKKAKVARREAEKMVTLARKGDLAARRRAVSLLRRRDCVAELFDSLVKQFEGRNGGYTRIIRTAPRVGDGAEMAYLEWVTSSTEAAPASEEPAAAETA